MSVITQKMPESARQMLEEAAVGLIMEAMADRPGAKDQQYTNR